MSSPSSSRARWVLHIDMDAFFASVEQLTRPTLRGRPVLVGGAGGRGVVAGASYEARVFGARSAMPMHQARRLVGATAVVLPPRGAVYREVSGKVFAAVRELVPVIETLSFDEAFAEPDELTGADRTTAVEFAERLRAAVREATGLAASVGVGSGKQIAKIASGLAKPDGVVAIEQGSELAFLHPLPVRKLWGIGPVAGDRLQRLGIDTIGDLARMSRAEVESVLGTTIGPALHLLAQGYDDRPVAERAEAKQISAESTFATDLVELGQLRRAVESAGTHAHRRLLEDGRGAKTVVVKMKKADMSILTRSATLSAATTELPTLLAAAGRLVLDPLEIGPVRLVGVSYSGLSAVQQFSMFPELDGPDADNLDPVASGDAAPPDDGPAVPERVQIPGDTVGWRTGADVVHPVHGHGWVQGSGHGVVTVRFETRSSGPGFSKNLDAADPDLTAADPLRSLD
ncbi:DNA polymerase IV [Jongsikchunia kroppenstedtii]|uniref:DNA polymerase IV n=1 Tax=Jongsikchunia kroppenstedtii TaxID=1121721 RepID=UPI000372700F|nr:DNA polymerase IV [Jongsikchunia kroppenstedtii]